MALLSVSSLASEIDKASIFVAAVVLYKLFNVRMFLVLRYSKNFDDLSERWNSQYDRPPVEYIALKVQVNFQHSLRRYGWYERGTTSVYFEITYVCFILSRLPVFVVGPQYQHYFFIFCQKHHLNDTQNLWKIRLGLKLEWGL